MVKDFRFVTNEHERLQRVFQRKRITLNNCCVKQVPHFQDLSKPFLEICIGKTLFEQLAYKSQKVSISIQKDKIFNLRERKRITGSLRH